jgi:rod shape-determining protein MreD
MSRHLKYLFLSIVLLLLQAKTMTFLTLEGITPDLLVIWVVILALKEGQLAAMPWGFGIGLAFDLATGSFLGLSALTKTIAAFSAGYFFDENKTGLTLGSYRFLIVVLVASLIHNTVYFAVFTRGSEIGLLRAVFQVGLATTFYTATVALLPMLAFARRYIS